MRQLIQMFLCDVKLNTKSFMGAYIVIVPMIILIVLSRFLPTVADSTVTIAVVTEGPNAVKQEIISALDEFADIEKYDSIEDMKQKLRAIGIAEGLYWDPDKDQYVSVLERTPEKNKIFSFASKYIRQIYYKKNYPDAPRVTLFSYGVPKELGDRTKTSPVATMGGSIFLVFLVFIAGYIIGAGVVNDKEYGTNKALQVSPVSKADYFIGKSIYPLLVMLFYTIIAMLVLGLTHVNILQVYIVVLLSFTTTLLLGLFVGAIGKNEVESIGIVKLLGTVLMLVILGSTLLPENWRWVVWWAPFYWSHNIMEEIFTETITWGNLAWKSTVMVGLSVLYFFLLRKKIVKGLS